MGSDRPQPVVPRGRFRAFVYEILLASAQALYKAGNGCVFTAAGLLGRDELQAASVAQDRRFNWSANDVDAGLSLAEARFYGHHLRAGDRVLLAGSGTGRDLIGLRRLGYDVTGVEPSAEAVEIARQHLDRLGMSAPILSGLIQTVDLTGQYNAVIFSNGCYSMIQGTAARVAALRRVAQHLAPDGRVLVSYPPRRSQSMLGRWLTKAAARISGAGWTPEAGDTFVPNLHTRGAIGFQHTFAPSEFARECEAAGLTLIVDGEDDDGYLFAAAARA
jgi:2-polyprenyl-3-methyl-5-hydroxy-6-metoxy-1,4-benzoquinol methylase